VGLHSGQPVVLSGINSTTTGAPRAFDTLLHGLYFLFIHPIVTVQPTSLTIVNLFYCGDRLRFGFYCSALTDATAVMPHCQMGLCNLKCKTHLCILQDGDDLIFSEPKKFCLGIFHYLVCSLFLLYAAAVGACLYPEIAWNQFGEP